MVTSSFDLEHTGRPSCIFFTSFVYMFTHCSSEQEQVSLRRSKGHSWRYQTVGEEQEFGETAPFHRSGQNVVTEIDPTIPNTPWYAPQLLAV